MKENTKDRERWEAEGKKEQQEERNCAGDAEEIDRNGGERENVGCGQSIIQKRKVRRTWGAALNMPAWHHLLMGHRLTCYLSSPHPSQQLFLSSYAGSYQCSLVERVNNYSMTTLLCELEGCLHKEERIYFKRAMGYFKKMGELFMEACLEVFVHLCFCMFGVFGDTTSWE